MKKIKLERASRYNDTVLQLADKLIQLGQTMFIACKDRNYPNYNYHKEKKTFAPPNNGIKSCDQRKLIKKIIKFAKWIYEFFSTNFIFFSLTKNFYLYHNSVPIVLIVLIL